MLILASQILQETHLYNQLNHNASRLLASIDKNGWLCGVPLGVETPGLMIGLAGIGYGLLRLADPVRVPSILVLDPPAHH